MNELQIFKNEELGTIRLVVIEDEVWFVGKDVAMALGYTDLTHCITDHVDDEDRVNSKTRGQNDPEFGQRGTWLINESGLYSLVLSSKLPTAKKFKRWVTNEVLPSIRKHGMYATDELLNNPDIAIAAFTALKEEREKNAALTTAVGKLEAKVEEDKPKVLFAQAVETAKTSILIGELAKLLRQNGIETGQRRLFEQLRQEGYLMKSGSSYNMPTQRSMEMGLFEVKESIINNPDGTIKINKTTKVTGKGQTYFINKFLV